MELLLSLIHISSSFSIGNVSVTELSASGYRVTAKINAPSGVSKVLMPTWTNANGQDDLVWHQASVSGDTATFYVPSSAHKGESGAYTTQDVYKRQEQQGYLC